MPAQKIMPSALTIAGSDSGGGAGIQADLKTFAAHSVHGLSTIVALTAQNTKEVLDIFELPQSFIESQLKALKKDFEIGAAKTGMLYSKKIISTVAKNLGDYPLVVDPVIIAESGAQLLKEEAIETLKKELLPKAILTTPNLFEAEKLAGIKIKTLEDMKKACKEIAKFGCSAIVKGGHLKAVDVLYHENKFYEFEGEKLEGKFHGAGCTFSASITANLAKGDDLITAVKNSKKFIQKALENSKKIGKGEVKVLNQYSHVLKEAEKHFVIESLRKAVEKIEENREFYKLIPEVGMNICFALENTSSLNDVAGVRGRIVKFKDRAKAVGCIEFGASKHIARVVLAAMSFDKSYRAAMNIKYSRELIQKLKKTQSFKISTFRREEEPAGEKTMEWGTKEAVKKLGKMPDIIYDEGAVGKEAMIRIIGKTPEEVMEKAERILKQ